MSTETAFLRFPSLPSLAFSDGAVYCSHGIIPRGLQGDGKCPVHKGAVIATLFAFHHEGRG